ncbi:hypothetical protein KJ652_07150 [Patescibacteria group bacterium]|nr:hypothetical protein [Patescibacteria group bacterium]MBU1124326.1 hypothetical protein [Patescibacteria group bacterium]
MDRILKFILKLNEKDSERVLKAYRAILENKLDNLDIKPISERKWWFRCRIGKVRIVFIRVKPGVNVAHEINFRDKSYRKK